MMRNDVKEKIKINAISHAKSILIKDGQNPSDKVVNAVCHAVAERVINDSRMGLPNSSLNLESLQQSKNYTFVKNCTSINTEDDFYSCAVSILSSISVKDLNGLTSIVTNAIQQECPWV